MKRKNKSVLLLLASVLMILVLTGVYSYQVYMDNRVPVPYTERVMGIPVVENLDFLEGLTETTSEQNPGVLFGGALMPYDSDGTLYLAQDFQQAEWIGELKTDGRGSFLCMLSDEAWQNKADAIRDGHVFHLFMVEEQQYYALNLVVCGMPVVTMKTEWEEPQDLGDYETNPDKFCYEPDVVYYGQIQVFNPGVRVSKYEITEAGVKYHFRGDSSSSFEKKSYAIGLLDSKGNNLDASLLGMREDNLWKLKAMVADTRKIREKTACDLWEKFAATNEEVNEEGPRMEYVELVVDNDYVGLYGMVEPVDSKKLGLDKNDVLYKSTHWIVPEDEDFDYAIERSWPMMTYIRIRYPESITDYTKTWYPVRDYMNTFYNQAGDGRPAEDKIYVTNAVDNLLFTMAVSGSDNHFRNLYFAADVSESGEYKMRQIPWDLDLTFGAIVGGSFKDDETVVYEEHAIPYLKENGIDVYQPYLKERWMNARETFLSTEAMLDLFHANQDYLLNAGVVERENTRWPDYKMSTDLGRLEDLLVRRMEWLDEYFAVY